MEWKIVFSDIDGTVLNSKHELLASTIDAVQKLALKNIPFVLVSARMPKAMKLILDEMKVKMPMISYGGALVLDEQNQILYDNKINKIDTEAIISEIELLWPDDVVINYYSDDNWFVKDENNKAVKREENITNVKASQADFKNLIANNILPNKILCMTKANISSKIEAVLQEKFPQLNIVRSSDILIEIMNKDVSKADGIEVLLHHLKMTPAQAIAFGDNYNDLTMLNFVGRGVVMQNAPEEIRKEAKYITKSNNEDGIYEYLKQINMI
ncbi:Cof-type HAD-IIB family hydrolase [uncultured Megamonas sp.]|uniref:Cof-type HAD-IIB family hydrolase n=1 Tax=uncultured Megamonas sp. TaxID=286140 RepID=UPI00267022FB|nr:Cof-type HAD-IIB family hydrolase [uncultured Megamonas sp.]